MTESEIQKEIIAYLKVQGFLVLRTNAGSVRHNVKMAPSGFPDLMVIMGHGKVLFIEVKTPTGKVSDIQLNMHDRLIVSGHDVMVARSVEDVQKYV